MTKFKGSFDCTSYIVAETFVFDDNKNEFISLYKVSAYVLFSDN